MTTMTQTTKQRKPLKPPQAVHGIARWIGGTPTPGQLDDGDAILQITATGKEPAFYYVTTIMDHGRRLGFRLVKIDGLEQTANYDIETATALWTCDCPDATYCDRPGGCKHIGGLRAALKAVELL